MIVLAQFETWQIVTLLTIAIIAIAVFVWLKFFRNGRSPSVSLIMAIETAIMQLQQRAFQNVITEDAVSEPNEAQLQAMEHQKMSVQNLIELIYSIEHHEKGFLHVISSRLTVQRPKEFQIQCMLFVMVILTRQLDEFGISEKDVSFDVDQSELGTHYLYMLLTTEQHAKIGSKFQN